MSRFKRIKAGMPININKADVGRIAWRWLHTEAAIGNLTTDRLREEFNQMIPSFGCQCRKDWKAIIAANPFRTSDQFVWSVEVHNCVNRLLTKTEMNIEDARVLWNIDK